MTKLTISTHAPRVGSDVKSSGETACTNISIHAPRVGSDICEPPRHKPRCNFNPRSPCGERLLLQADLVSFLLFQSTLPVWGATKKGLICDPTGKFQSTLPVWGATAKADKCSMLFSPNIGAFAKKQFIIYKSV